MQSLTVVIAYQGGLADGSYNRIFLSHGSAQEYAANLARGGVTAILYEVPATQVEEFYPPVTKSSGSNIR